MSKILGFGGPAEMDQFFKNGGKIKPKPASSLKTELEFIVKSHACTQVGFDEASLRDYPIMIDKILSLLAQEVKAAREDERIKIAVEMSMLDQEIMSLKAILERLG